MLIVSATTTVVLLVIALALPVPYVRLSPGPTFDVIGAHDGTPVISITGATTYPTDGQLDMTTIYERGGPRTGLSLFEAIAAWANPTDAVVPRELLYPDDVSGEEVKQRQAMLFSNSESHAVAAALRHLDMPVKEQVVASLVYADSPAFGILEAGDRIVSVDGVATTTPEAVGDYVRSKPIGTTFTFEVDRAGTTTTHEVTSRENPDEAGRPFIGIGVGVDYQADFDISFTLEDVGGPSAGLMFATGLVDKLTPESLTGGGHVAGTGTIDPDGTVGPIGGIRQKLAGAAEAGAEFFLMPKDHCAEAAGHVPDGLAVAPVSTLDEAIAALDTWRAGGELPQCPVEVTAASAS